MIVFDASTLILLAKIDLLQIVLGWFPAVIPNIIKEEVLNKKTEDSVEIEQLIAGNKLRVVINPPQKELTRILNDFPLAGGEASALLLAKKENKILATDDGVAIKACKILGVKFATAIHFLIEARQRGCLDESFALAKLELLSKYGRYSQRIIKDAEGRIKGGK